MIEPHVVGPKATPHAHVSSKIATELIGKSRLHHPVGWEHPASIIHVCHIGVNWRGHAHHVGAETSRDISGKLSWILSHLSHVFHNLVKLSDRVQSCRGLLLQSRLRLLMIGVNNWLLLCWLLNYRLCIE